MKTRSVTTLFAAGLLCASIAACSDSNDQPNPPATPTTSTVSNATGELPFANDGIVLNFKVKGMTCTGCEDAIESALVKIDGVKSCEASHKDGTVVVKADKPQDPSQIVKAITDSGFEAEHSGS